MEELIQSEIFSPFLRSFTKGNSIPSWQCFIRAAFNAYNIMQNRKLTVTKSNFFRQKVFAVIPGDLRLVIQHQPNILSLLWYEGNTENEGVIVVCSSWRQNIEIGYFKVAFSFTENERPQMRAARAAENRAARVACAIIIKLKLFLCAFDR